MKTSIKLFIAICSVLISSSALAVDGTINITGNIIDASCTISINGGAANTTVELPKVSTTALASDGAVAGSMPLNFNLSGCPPNSVVLASFESNNVDQSTGFLANKSAAPAGNVEVQILNRNGHVIDLRNQVNNFGGFTDAIGNTNLTFNLRYVAVGGAATAGGVDTLLVYTLHYP
ncbi:fimbrial protein [Pseudomonas sp. M30-35]|uniref:fimbrial protein n=1 Tax=Pseudomonas sp. M30-35 TaxID=1981174 RepID=UPI000B3CB10F|nr:fimbrial protein [Pseudomonas sp. M30-35]ARU86733.1 hypothetical protein B9K09_01450 [Pseudomonas sp. M30-35]